MESLTLFLNKNIVYYFLSDLLLELQERQV